MTNHGALTSCRQLRERLVRTKEESDRATGTDQLEAAEGETCQDTERKRLSKGHSLSVDARGRDYSEHGKRGIERGALTS